MVAKALMWQFGRTADMKMQCNAASRENMRSVWHRRSSPRHSHREKHAHAHYAGAGFVDVAHHTGSGDGTGSCIAAPVAMMTEKGQVRPDECVASKVDGWSYCHVENLFSYRVQSHLLGGCETSQSICRVADPPSGIGLFAEGVQPSRLNATAY